MAATLFGDDAVAGKVAAQALDDEALGGAVGFGDQVEITLQLEGDSLFEVCSQERAGLACDIDRRFQVGGQLELYAFLDQVLDIVLEDEQVGQAGARDADEGGVVVFDDAANLLIVAEAHANGRAALDQALQVFRFLERMLGRPRPRLATGF